MTPLAEHVSANNPEDPVMRRVTLYTKEGCHLCDDVLRELRRLSATFNIDIVQQDICETPDLYSTYRFDIPVVEIEDGPVMRAPITPQQLQRALAE
ncbi:MAG: glutaredoxin family protein [Chloroflexota bacterium]|nr:glutaredoxin family protein [Chloroflexota bacterium]